MVTDEELLTPLPGLVAAVGPRSLRAAREALIVLYKGDLERTVQWMASWSMDLQAAPRDLAEESDEGLERVLHYIGAIEAGT